jgi:drug/metabolite transporter (DMT)-like permease
MQLAPRGAITPEYCPKEFTMYKTVGIIMIVLGLFGLVWGGFTYTTRERVVDVGPIHATREKTHNVPLPPVVGAVAVIGGAILLAAGKRA